MITDQHISSKKKGFTLIELLIVIGILGILAAGLLAAIDPIEQLKKGQDSNRRGVAVEYQTAFSRYFATYASYPWGVGAFSAASLNAAGPTAYTASLVALGELKSTFNAGAGAANEAIMSLSSDASGNVYVCFKPTSKAVSGDPSTVFSLADGTIGGLCPTGVVGACFWCAR
jgi:prepilin-type N-terminal cleavage/methylation domain-containing protein